MKHEGRDAEYFQIFCIVLLVVIWNGLIVKSIWQDVRGDPATRELRAILRNDEYEDYEEWE